MCLIKVSTIFCSYSFSIAKTNAERMKKYRAKLKEDKTRYEATKITYQKWILLNNLRETFELFKEENNNVNISRSSFAELRPTFVIPNAALAHRNCLCLYHENICLLLESVDKYVDGKYCSSSQAFTDCLVCSATSEECMFGCCLLCRDFFFWKSGGKCWKR